MSENSRQAGPAAWSDEASSDSDRGVARSRWWRRFRRRDDRSRIDPADAQHVRFWTLLELELERARRHERSFALSRVEVPGVDVDHDRAMAALSDIRVSDALTSVDGGLTILWSESDGEAADRALRRLVKGLPAGPIVAARTVVFPDNGLSLTTLVEALDQAPALPIGASTVRAPATDAVAPSIVAGETTSEDASMVEGSGPLDARSGQPIRGNAR